MTHQRDLFSFGQPTRADLEKLIARLYPDYTRAVCECALEVAAANQDFTAEDVRLHCEPKPGAENSFSVAMLEAKRLGIFEVIGYRKALRKEAKSRAIPLYRRAFVL